MKSLFTKKEFKKIIPAGQFLFINSDWNIEKMLKLALDLSIFEQDYLSLKKGKLQIKRHMNTKEPEELITQITNLTKKFIKEYL